MILFGADIVTYPTFTLPCMKYSNLTRIEMILSGADIVTCPTFPYEIL